MGVLFIITLSDAEVWMLNDNEIGGVDYNGIVSPIIKAIQQLSDSVDQLKQEKWWIEQWCKAAKSK